MKIAIQGGKASFHEIAARKFFNNEIEVIECKTFREVCKQLKNGNADYAAMAIENSIAGIILGNYSLIKEYDFKIMGEIELRIEQNLMALPGVQMSDITKVRSHYMALGQCEEFLSRYPEVKLEEYHDTADSARDLRLNNEKTIAAIASRYAAEHYGLTILAESIETEKKNFTKFLILTTDKKIRIDGAEKAILSFQLPNTVGALANVLKLVVDNNINLTKIQSIPIVGKPNEYTFYIECEWKDYDDFKKSIEINSIVRDLKILGEFKKGQTINDYSKS